MVRQQQPSPQVIHGILHGLKTLDETYVQQLAQFIGMTYAYCHKILNWLKDRGLVEDRKALKIHYYKLTEKGEEVLELYNELHKRDAV